MLHLFKEVYANYDKNINLKYYRVVISETQGFQIDQTLGDPNRLLHFATSFESLIGFSKQFPSFLDFIKYLSEKQDELGAPIQVYLDKAAFVKFTAHWYKLIFANATADASFNYIRTYQSKININKLDRSSSPDQYLIDRAEFTQAFNSVNEGFTSAATFVGSIAPALSLELIVASYLGSNNLKSVLTEKLRLTQLADLGSFMKEIRIDILNSVLRSKFKNTFNLGTYTVDNLESSVNDPALNFFFNIYNTVADNLNNNTNNWSAVSDADIDAALDTIERMAKEIDSIENTSSVYRLSLIKHLKSSNLETDWLPAAIDYEIDSHCSFFCSLNPVFNSLFMDVILEPIRIAKRNGQEADKGYLAPYRIRGAE